MTGLILNKKTGFKNNEPLKSVIIRDFRGKLFYSTEGLREVKKFNLPPGEYQIEKGNITVLEKPIKYNLIKLPKPDRNLKPPTDFTIEFGINPNKCTINWDLHTILFDNELLNRTIPELWFILFHEYGHSLYSSEKLADLMSANLMYKRGFNPSQIGKAPLTSLSSFQYKRKRHIVNKLINR